MATQGTLNVGMYTNLHACEVIAITNLQKAVANPVCDRRIAIVRTILSAYKLITPEPSEIGGMIHPSCLTKSRWAYLPRNLNSPIRYIIPSISAGVIAGWPLPYFVYRIRTAQKKYGARRKYLDSCSI